MARNQAPKLPAGCGRRVNPAGSGSAPTDAGRVAPLENGGLTIDTASADNCQAYTKWAGKVRIAISNIVDLRVLIITMNFRKDAVPGFFHKIIF